MILENEDLRKKAYADLNSEQKVNRKIINFLINFLLLVVIALGYQEVEFKRTPHLTNDVSASGLEHEVVQAEHCKDEGVNDSFLEDSSSFIEQMTKFFISLNGLITAVNGVLAIVWEAKTTSKNDHKQ